MKTYVVRYNGWGSVNVEQYTNGEQMVLVKSFTGAAGGYEANLAAATAYAREIAAGAPVRVLP